MKRIYSLLFVLMAATFVKAAPGDTTWVQAHNNVWLDWYNNFDTTIKFPDGTTKYRKVIMVFTLGKYVCPGSPTYCSDWDYTVQIYGMNKKGDTAELGRMITPYGKGARMPAAWTQPYYFDVTDYAGMLQDSNKIRILYSGYSGGFTANIRFAMIEGTPDRNVLGFKRTWDGSFAYGDVSTPIDAKVAATSFTAPAGTQSAVYRMNITGHGADANYCSEFCAKYYRVAKDGTMFTEKLIWRDNCGVNNLYPQSGTWVYNRGNWCPGALVYTNFHEIPSVTGGSTFSLNMNFEPYTSSGGAIYTVAGSVVYYGGFNKTLDASIEEIIAPTNNANFFRENARTGYTTIKLHNSGSTAISSVEFLYGVSGKTLKTTTWSGTLAPLKDTVIDLPFANSLLAASGTDLTYEVNIVKVNGKADDDNTNNRFTTLFNAAPQWPTTFTVSLTTNKAVTGTGVSETDWHIINVATGAIVKERINSAPSTVFYDTVTLPTGVYKLQVTDAGCDGLSWWANPGAGSGTMSVKPTLFTSLPLPGLFSGDFGCGFDQYFRVGDPVNTGAANYVMESAALSVFPNPAKDHITVHLMNIVAEGTITLTDNMGKTVYVAPVHHNLMEIPVAQYAAGLYFVHYLPADAAATRLIQKCVIMK